MDQRFQDTGLQQKILKRVKMIYVISKSGSPLMPTKRHGWVRKALQNGRAKVIQRSPFTIQLTYDSQENTQPITLGIDAGYETYWGSDPDKVLFL